MNTNCKEGLATTMYRVEPVTVNANTTANVRATATAATDTTTAAVLDPQAG